MKATRLPSSSASANRTCNDDDWCIRLSKQGPGIKVYQDTSSFSQQVKGLGSAEGKLDNCNL